VTDPEPLPDGHALRKAERGIVTPQSANPTELSRPGWLLTWKIRSHGSCSARISWIWWIQQPDITGY
jgi:hypothetical protein